MAHLHAKRPMTVSPQYSPALRGPPPSACGFTIVELLAALAVLMLIFGMLLQIFNNTVAATQASRQQLDATQQNRFVIDALHGDLANLVVQEGAATVFVQEEPLAARVVFLTRSRGPDGAQDFRFLAVAYQLNGNSLRRHSTPVSWTKPDLMKEALSADSSSTASTLSESILRFQIMLNLDNGATVLLSTAGPWLSAQLIDEQVPDGYSALLLAGPRPDPVQPRVRSLTVAVAALDPLSLRLPDVSNMGSALGLPEPGQTYAEAWATAANSGALAAFPAPAVRSLRIAQSTFPLSQ